MAWTVSTIRRASSKRPFPGLCLGEGGSGRVPSEALGPTQLPIRGLLPTELTGMCGWILLRSPYQGRGSPPAPAHTKQRPAPPPPPPQHHPAQTAVCPTTTPASNGRCATGTTVFLRLSGESGRQMYTAAPQYYGRSQTGPFAGIPPRAFGSVAPDKGPQPSSPVFVLLKRTPFGPRCPWRRSAGGYQPIAGRFPPVLTVARCRLTVGGQPTPVSGKGDGRSRVPSRSSWPAPACGRIPVCATGFRLIREERVHFSDPLALRRASQGHTRRRTVARANARERAPQ